MSLVHRILCFMGGILAVSFLSLYETGYAEWYVAAYGGVSTNGEITNVDLPTLAASTVKADPTLYNPACANIFSNCMINQQMDASDIELNDSPMFGAKVGHFFNEMDFPWLGLELEAFTSEPDIKSQTLNTRLTGSSFIPPPFGTDVGVPRDFDITGQLQVTKSSLRVTTLALNVLTRYPGEIFQPYIGVGVGGFWFKGSGQFQGSRIVPGLNALGGLRIQILENWVIFAEAKYNRATVDGLGPTLGMDGNYEIVHWLGGVAFVFGTN